MQKRRITKLFTFEGLKQQPVLEASAGEIIALAGIEGIYIGETVADAEDPKPLPPIQVDEPTISMIFHPNTSPLAGRDGKYVTSRQSGPGLKKKRSANVSIRIDETEEMDSFKVPAAANFNWES